ncbi:chromatin target of PRMT1 protein-like isoform X2 [Pararge aegeria]|uniref:Jg3782 protein n=1 Tax=Pararge aegeria aegeria TaxID=348720 RepID=A0A8S4SM18_9NEOP|nr:chromatin target of PRMT1 protein-like isoform X2 [Pararge aegeria]CAH2268522.1 jg3782 [Pararge aegeria aegeria]
MVIEKLHGLQATSISLNDRFTLLATTTPVVHAARVPRQRRRSTGLFSFGQHINNRNIIDQIAQRLGQQSKRDAVRQRLGIPALRRFGSESSLPGLWRSNSISNMSMRSVQARAPWRQSNGNLRSASFSNLSQGNWRGRGFRRRGGRMGLMRGRMRSRGGRQQIVGKMRGQSRGQRRTMRGQNGQNVQNGRGRGRGQNKRGATPGRGRGVGRGGGSGGASNQNKQTVTKEELDLQLDQYMASTKTALDKELDAYMKNAMEME